MITSDNNFKNLLFLSILRKSYSILKTGYRDGDVFLIGNMNVGKQNMKILPILPADVPTYYRR